MKKFLSSNEAIYRLLRTIAQGIVGVLIANLDLIIGQFSFDPTLKPMIVAMVMAVLSPVMAMLGETKEVEEHDGND